jgi:hypothetical protein
VCDLAVQIARLDRVAVHEAEGAYACASEIQRCGTPQPTKANDEDLGVEEVLLAVETKLRQQQLAIVSARGQRGGGEEGWKGCLLVRFGGRCRGIGFETTR